MDLINIIILVFLTYLGEEWTNFNPFHHFESTANYFTSDSICTHLFGKIKSTISICYVSKIKYTSLIRIAQNHWYCNNAYCLRVLWKSYSTFTYTGNQGRNINITFSNWCLKQMNLSLLCKKEKEKVFGQYSQFCKPF